jgi:hypothetical protein
MTQTELLTNLRMRTHGTHHVMCYGSGQAQSLFSPEHIEFLVTLF